MSTVNRLAPAARPCGEIPIIRDHSTPLGFLVRIGEVGKRLHRRGASARTSQRSPWHLVRPTESKIILRVGGTFELAGAFARRGTVAEIAPRRIVRIVAGERSARWAPEHLLQGRIWNPSHIPGAGCPRSLRGEADSYHEAQFAPISSDALPSLPSASRIQPFFRRRR